MLEKIYRSSTPFFNTYHIYDTVKQHFVGILEDHSRGVKQRYFIGWRSVFKDCGFTFEDTHHSKNSDSYRAYRKVV